MGAHSIKAPRIELGDWTLSAVISADEMASILSERPGNHVLVGGHQDQNVGIAATHISMPYRRIRSVAESSKASMCWHRGPGVGARYM